MVASRLRDDEPPLEVKRIDGPCFYLGLLEQRLSQSNAVNGASV